MEIGFGERDGSPGEEVGLRKLVTAFVEIGTDGKAAQVCYRVMEECGGWDDQRQLPGAGAGTLREGFAAEG